MKRQILQPIAIALVLALSSLQLAASPSHVEPLTDFKLESYLGTWHEIARIENSIEEGLSNVTASYYLKKNGTIKVINKGFNDEDGEWEEAEGRAYFNSEANIAHLDVTFFWPFYVDYIVFEFEDSENGYAFVTSDSTDYLWLLARKPVVDDTLVERFLMLAEQMEFNTKELIFVSQARYIQQSEKMKLADKLEESVSNGDEKKSQSTK
jgi:apolipoprotein D and lipocalin family protein